MFKKSQAELLNIYWEKLKSRRGTTPPEGLDGDMASLVVYIHEHAELPKPDPAMMERLRIKVLVEIHRPSLPPYRRILAMQIGFASTIMAILALCTIGVLTHSSEPIQTNSDHPCRTIAGDGYKLAGYKLASQIDCDEKGKLTKLLLDTNAMHHESSTPYELTKDATNIVLQGELVHDLDLLSQSSPWGDYAELKKASAHIHALVTLSNSALFDASLQIANSTLMEVGGEALVTNTDGDNIRVREGAGIDYDRIATAHEGEVALVLAGPSNDSKGNTWYKVQVPDGTGWMLSDFLVYNASLSTSSIWQSLDSGSSFSKLSGFAYVANTD